jgi:hypothetical protein
MSCRRIATVTVTVTVTELKLLEYFEENIAKLCLKLPALQPENSTK